MTEAERIVAWAERKADGEPPAKRPQGKAGHLTEVQRHEIRLAYLEQGGSVSKVALAAQFNVNRDTISACLQGPAFDTLREQFQQELRAVALERLRSYVVPAADAWRDSIDAAAQKGDHRPARDLLLHTKVIEPVQSGPRYGLHRADRGGSEPGDCWGRGGDRSRADGRLTVKARMPS